MHTKTLLFSSITCIRASTCIHVRTHVNNYVIRTFIGLLYVVDTYIHRRIHTYVYTLTSRLRARTSAKGYKYSSRVQLEIAG